MSTGTGETRIERVGAEGDGIGSTADGVAIFVPFTLPGERVLVSPPHRRGEAWAAEPLEVLAASPEREAPLCPHFGACGGCALQHWRGDAYGAWKSSLLATALARAGYPDIALAPLTRTPPGGRRRIDLACRRDGARVTLGLHRRGGGDIIDLADCTVLHPALVVLLPALRAVLRSLQALRREGSALLNLLDTGPDLLLRTDGPLAVADRQALAAFASDAGVPRIAWARKNGEAETACQIGPVSLALGGAPVVPPPGAFLQASCEGEQAIREAVLSGLPAKLAGKARIVELYAGIGTLTFALAERVSVLAYEGDAAAVVALRAAATGRRITVTQRDLARQPLQPAELRDAAAVVLDPPWAGAPAQIAALARAPTPPKRLIYVSCNPAALARDARTLRDAGYAVTAATPVDQFLWSARLESVVIFSR